MNLPADFINSINLLLGSETEIFLSSLKENAPVSIRLNPFKTQRNHLDLYTLESPVLWSEHGYYLKDRPSFTFDPLFHAGYYYVQEASSMFIEQVVKQLIKDPILCLDLCAAPGGKSTNILSVLPHGSLLVSNEIVRHRANILSENMIKFGCANSVVTNSEAKDFAALPDLFNLILIDAPCSGEGMFRKDEIAIQEWSEGNVIKCAARQKNILNDVWPSLKPGGILIYSTCTYNTLENEDNALYAAMELGADFMELELDKNWGISSSFNDKVKGYRFFPHKTKGEGLFVTVLKKPTSSLSENNPRHNKKNKKKNSFFLKDSSHYKKYLKNYDDFNYIENNSRIIALPKNHSEAILNLNNKLKIVSMGIELGEIKGKDFIPSHHLAMSIELDISAFITKELSFNEAISYLRSEAIVAPDSPKGFILLTYKNEPIGFVKNIGNRANNLYPNAWRIRSGYR